jgi:predicted  nucleic acid-binding Zn-ribbon protein
MRQRIDDLEEALKKKSDQDQTVKLVRLEQLRDRVRQMDEANRADQQRIFDTNRKAFGATDPQARAAVNREIGTIQIGMARRGQELRTLREEIAKLEAETATGVAPATATTK